MAWVPPQQGSEPTPPPEISTTSATRPGISEQSFYRWKAKYGGMEVSEARRLRELEAENGKLKRLLAEAHLDNAALKDVLGRKW
jgi:putative transposase